VAVVRLLGDPDSTRAWAQGAQGEAQTARQLERHLSGRGVIVLHDRRIPGRGNIDHLTVGPGGITVIDTKSSRGRLQLRTVGGILSPRREQLLVNRRDRTSQLDGLGRQIAAVKRVLAKANLDQVQVLAALCYPNIDGLPRLGQLRARSGTIIIDHPRGVAKLARRPGPLNLQLITQVAEQLARRLPPA